MLLCLRRPLALGLSLALLASASGCGKGASSPSPTPTALTETQAPEEHPVDYSKYNDYIDVYDMIYTMSDILDAYFEAVADTPEFALLEGADYGAVQDLISPDINLSYPIEQALEWADKEPAYPDVDKAAKELIPHLVTLMKQFGSLELYMVFSEYEEDNYEKAAACHAELYPAVKSFYTWAPQFVDAMDILTEETNQIELERLLKEERLIAYYSNLTIDGAQALRNAVREQLYGLEEGESPDMESIHTAYEKFQEDSAALLKNLEDQEQIEKIRYFVEGTRYGEKGEVYLGYYVTTVEDLRYYLDTLMELMGSGADCADALDTVSSGISKLIDRYNQYIVS